MIRRLTRKSAWKAAAAGAILALTMLVWASGWSSDETSACYGVNSKGALRDAWKLPRRGPNFRVYNLLPWLLGRTFVHSAVYDIVLDAYAMLAASGGETTYVYGETGFARGGRFRPHRTHQVGLSVDFMVPVRDASGVPRELPTSIFDQFGYSHEFDDSGVLGGSSAELRIDFEALAAHLAALKRSAAIHHVRISRVIFEAPLREHLTTTRAWPEIANLPFNVKPPWIRHDEHFHVDFDVPCRPLSDLE